MPCSPTNDTGSVRPATPPAGFAGTFSTWSDRLIWQVLAAAGPLEGPSVMVELGVSFTSPDAGSGALRVNEKPAQGAVDASPDADSKVNTPGSRLGGRQCPPPAVSAHAGVTVIGAVNEPVGTSFTLSVSFGVVDVLTMVILAENVLPT